MLDYLRTSKLLLLASVLTLPGCMSAQPSQPKFVTQDAMEACVALFEQAWTHVQAIKRLRESASSQWRAPVGSGSNLGAISRDPAAATAYTQEAARLDALDAAMAARGCPEADLQSHKLQR